MADSASDAGDATQPTAYQAEHRTATRDANDLPYLQKLVGRFLQRYFGAYGLYTARIMQVLRDDCAALITYEDGDTDRLYLDQLQRHLMPRGWIPPAVQNAAELTSKFNCTWPPPSLSSKMVIDEPRRRRKSQQAVERELYAATLRFEKEMRAREKQEARLMREQKRAEAAQRAAAAEALTHMGMTDKQAAPQPATQQQEATDIKLNRSTVTTSKASKPTRTSKTSKPTQPTSSDIASVAKRPKRNSGGARASAHTPVVENDPDAIRTVQVGSGRVLVSGLSFPIRINGIHRRIMIEHDADTPHGKRSTTGMRKRIIAYFAANQPYRYRIPLSDLTTYHHKAVCKRTIIEDYVPNSQNHDSVHADNASDAGLVITESSDHEDSMSASRDARASQGLESRKRRSDGGTSNGRQWTRCPTCTRKHWNDQDCGDVILPPCGDDPETHLEQDRPRSRFLTGQKRWGGATTTKLYETLQARCNSQPSEGSESTPATPGVATPLEADTPPQRSDSPSSDAKTEDPNEALNPDTAKPESGPLNEARIIKTMYKIVNSKARKLDVTCGADGRYGITGNVTRGSMHHMLAYLRQECELDENATMIDLGHGMGRPNLHAAGLVPPIRASVGTEFNPQLYKQSMLALSEVVAQFEHLQSKPCLFFMDHNIKDIRSFNGFSHVYAFNIGMPDDVISHILAIVKRSRDVKYLIIYPHRKCNQRSLAKIGKVIHRMSMQMPGQRRYEANIVKVQHDDSARDELDSDVKHAFDILSSTDMYSAYVQQLGIVTMGDNSMLSTRIRSYMHSRAPLVALEQVLDDEQQQVRLSRSSRHQAICRYFLEQSPCLPDISLGLLRRVCLALGVSTTGHKVDLLANIQAYCPHTFSISIFAIGEDYSNSTIEFLVQKLLKQPPSRRQPELSM